MFEQLYVHPYALARHQDAPLADERRRFLVHLAHQGESPVRIRAVASLLLRLIGSLDLVNRPNDRISREEIAVKVTRRNFDISMAVRWFRFLECLEEPAVPEHPYAEEIDAFVDYMRREKGAAESTIKGRSQFLRRFLTHIHPPNGQLRGLDVAQIDAAFLDMESQGKCKPSSVCTYASTLRAFFRYAATQKWCRQTLADAIPRRCQFAQTSLPSAPSWDDVQRLLKMTEGNRPIDIRDRPILMLLAIYGLRPGEVRQLMLDDFCWEEELLFVTSSKTHRTRSYPLIRSLGNAVLRYVREVRPHCAHREVFLTIRRPIGPLRSAMFDIVSRRLKRLGTPLRHYGPHALRHACATHLLAQGLSLKEIGDHLGHRHPDTTRIYAKVDLAGLRQVADFDLGELL